VGTADTIIKEKSKMKRKGQKVGAIRRARQRQVRVVVFGFIALLVLGAATYLFTAAFTPPTLPPADANTIDIRADMAGFTLKEIRVKAGEPVTVRLTSLDNSYHSDGGGRHQWAVDELDISIVAPPKGTNYATFTPEKPGVYTFYCDICCGGRANPSMQGKLIVEA
jgi:heme/copper-type cytochrome/quinol oxidase subunit 2